MSVRYFHKCLLPFLAAHEAVGWREVARSYVPSLFEWSVLLEWTRAGDPVLLETL